MPLADILPFRKCPPPIIDPRIQQMNREVWAQFARPSRAFLSSAAQYTARVDRVTPEAPDAVSLVLSINGTALTWLPGQFITLSLVHEGKTHQRAYSISAVGDPLQGDPTRCISHQIRITVKRVEGGLVSRLLTTGIKPGDSLRFTGPHGDFSASETQSPKLFIAGGSGITPILALLQAHLRSNPNQPCALIYSSRKLKEAIFAEELRNLEQQHPTLCVHWVETAGKPSRRLSPSKINPFLDGLPWLDAATTEVFLCGPDALNGLGQEVFDQRRFPAEHIHTERFLSHHHDATGVQSPQEIEFPQWHKHVIAQPDQSLLAAGLAAGLPMPHSCQVGGCGHCRVKVVKGEVKSDEPNCLSQEEAEQGYRLACVSYATGPVTLEIEGESK